MLPKLKGTHEAQLFSIDHCSPLGQAKVSPNYSNSAEASTPHLPQLSCLSSGLSFFSFNPRLSIACRQGIGIVTGPTVDCLPENCPQPNGPNHMLKVRAQECNPCPNAMVLINSWSKFELCQAKRSVRGMSALIIAPMRLSD